MTLSISAPHPELIAPVTVAMRRLDDLHLEAPLYCARKLVAQPPWGRPRRRSQARAPADAPDGDD